MDNIVLTASSQLSSNVGNPLNPRPIPPLVSEPVTTSTVESIVSNPLEPVSTTSVEPTQDVALTSTKSNGHQTNNSFPANQHHKMQMNDVDNDGEHPDKSKSCCSMLNKLVLALAIACFALFLCSLAYIIANLQGLNGKYDGRKIERPDAHYSHADYFFSSEGLISEHYFNLTHPTNEGIMVVLSRRGASIYDILIPSKDVNGLKISRSIVVKGGDQNSFGSVRFGFDDPKNSMNMSNQLPSNYPFLNFHQEDWLMYADINKPYRVRFVHGLVQLIYEFSSKRPNELVMTTMVATPSNQPIIADPTNNIYFNLRGDGNLSTHYLNISASNPIGIVNGQKIEQDRLIKSQRLDKLMNINNYFYKLEQAGLGKNHIATLFESETKTTMNIFSDHAGVVIDPFGVGLANPNGHHATIIPDMRGVRISPRQSPIYQPLSLYGPTLIVYPSQAIHTTWWQFDYET